MPEPAGEMSDYRERWANVQSGLRDKLGEPIYDAWFQQVEYAGCDDSALRLSVPTRFLRDWISSKYYDEIAATWRKVAPHAPPVSISVRANGANDPGCANGATAANGVAEPAAFRDAPPPVDGASSQSAASPKFAAKKTQRTFEQALAGPKTSLDEKLTFENFIIGESNRLAAAAAQRVAQQTAVAFNPLFLYGASGLGKTHLMHAIAWDIRERHPEKTVLYLSAERFMFHFVQAVRKNDTIAFKERFRGVDILMIDDIQFIGNKISTQEEFLHTLNELIDNCRQVVVSADRAPDDLDDLGVQDRIRQRLSNGLYADIHPANYELRLKILEHKRRLALRERPHICIADEVLEFLASKITSNARNLEGALNKLIAHCDYVGGEANVDTARLLLRDQLRAFEKRATIDEIQRLVCEHYELRMADLLSARRSRAIARPRQAAMYLSKILTTASLPEIGKKFGGRDHTTVIHAVRKIESLIAEDETIAADVAKLKRALSG